ncbi:MAG: hypothetical protein U0625_05855 [Phycisphaerales bacterium]
MSGRATSGARARAGAAGAVAALLALASCSGVPESTAARGAATANQTTAAGGAGGAGVVTAADQALAAAGCAILRSADAPKGAALDGALVEGLATGSVSWRRATARGGAPAVDTVTIETTHLPDGRWRRTAPEGARIVGRGDDGAVRLHEQTDAKDGATTLFEPPLLLAPARLKAGEQVDSDATVSVVRGAARDIDGGRAKRSVRIAGVDRIRTPLGEFDALRVETEFAMKVPFASLRRDSAVWVRPGFGPVAVRLDERMLVMGVVPRDRREALVRLPAGAEGSR